MRVRRRRVVAAVALLSLLAACGGGGDGRVQIGLKRLSLDLAFKADEEGKPKTATVIFQDAPESLGQFVIDKGASGLEPAIIKPLPSPPLVVRTDTCPTAEPGTVPEAVAGVSITTLVLGGRYDYHDTGSFDISGGLVPLKGRLAANSAREYRKTAVLPGDPAPDVALPPQPPKVAVGTGAPQYTFTVFQPGTGGNFTSREYLVKPTEVDLVSQTTKLGDATFEFKPIPPIKLMGLGKGQGDSWNSAGTDPATGTSMVVQGAIDKHETVDVCGKLYDTYRVRSSERIVSLSGARAFSSATADTTNAPQDTGPGLPNFYNIATQYGGLLVREEVHTTTTFAPYAVKIDSVSTLDDIEPRGAVSG